ncbi:MAG: ATP-binding protein [Opitutales bacterium]
MSPSGPDTFTRTRGFFLIQDSYATLWLELDGEDNLTRMAETAASLLQIAFLPGRRMQAADWSARLDPETSVQLRQLAKICRESPDQGRRNGVVVTLPGTQGRFSVTGEALCETEGAVRLTLQPEASPPASGVRATGKHLAMPPREKAAAPAQPSANEDTPAPEDEAEEAPPPAQLSMEAKSIVHDFKNLMVGIVGNLSLAQRQLGEDSTAAERLKAATSAAQRAKDLVLQLLSTQEPRALVKHPVRLVDLVEECVSETLGGMPCACTVELPEDLWTVPVDEGRFCQAFNNLLVNGMQAMDGTGTLGIRGENICLKAENPYHLPEGTYVRVNVQDEGPGVPEDLRERIFEPLFTTKSNGNGLGLSNVKKIFDNHGGTICLEPASAKGACFTFWLPALPEVSLPTVPPAASVSRERVLNILLVEDNPIVRQTTGDLLDAIGHKPSFAAGPQEALDQLSAQRARGQPIKVVLLDLNLSNGVHGRHLVPKLREREPELVIVVCSGSSTDPCVLEPERIRCNASLVKPFSVDELRRCIEGTLAQSKTRPPY